MTKDGHDGYIFYTEETAFGAVDDDQTWERMLEVETVSGRGPSQEVKDMRRHGKRGRAGAPRGKRDEDPLVFKCNMVDDSVATNHYDVFIQDIFKEDFDVAPTSYAFLISDISDPTDATAAHLEYYYGCTLDEIEISVEEGEVVTLSMSFIRKYFVSSVSELHAATGNSYEDYPSSITYLLWSDVTITKGASWSNSGSITNVSSITITVSQGGEKKFRINGTKLPKDIHFGEYLVTASMTIDYDDFDEITEVEDESVGDIVVVFSPTAGMVATITLVAAQYENAPYDSEVNSLITIDVDLSADSVTFA